MMSAIATDILNFWFDNPTAPESEYGQLRRVWFRKHPDFDQQVRDRFLTAYEAARQGHYDDWVQHPRPAVALVVLLDQFPRNMFRGTPQSFATDDQALAVAQQAIAIGHDQAVIPVERLFLYLPLEHSENLHHQQQCVTLIESLVEAAPDLESTLDYSYRHRDVIARFGRFPHRNAMLNRPSTPAEVEFLQQPGSRF